MIAIAYPHQFCKNPPNKTCPNAVSNTIASLHKGYEVKCRDPRCCFGGAGVWSTRHSLCVNRLLAEYIPDDMAIYRGSLKMHPDASPAEHRKTKDLFLRRVNHWRKSTGHRIELHGVLHITSPTDAHWDVIAYSNAPKTALKRFISEAWKGAGGRSQSLVPLAEGDELLAVAKYQAKDTTKPGRATRYLPASQEELGFNRVWSTRPSKLSAGFWNGTSEEALWEKIRAEYVASLSEKTPDQVREFRAKMSDRLRGLDPDAEAILKTFEWHEGSLGELQPSPGFFGRSAPILDRNFRTTNMTMFTP